MRSDSTWDMMSCNGEVEYIKVVVVVVVVKVVEQLKVVVVVVIVS